MDWLAEGKRVMEKVCCAKVTYDPRAKQFHLDTGDPILAEAGPNNTWGIGLNIDNQDVGLKPIGI